MMPTLLLITWPSVQGNGWCRTRWTLLELPAKLEVVHASARRQPLTERGSQPRRPPRFSPGRAKPAACSSLVARSAQLAALAAFCVQWRQGRKSTLATKFTFGCARRQGRKSTLAAERTCLDACGARVASRPWRQG